MAIIDDYVAIDPLALLLPSSVYQRLIEKFHPHVATVADVVEAAKGITADQRANVLAKARTLAAQAKVVEDAIGSMK